MEGLSTKKAVTVGLQGNAIPPGHGSTQGSNFSSIPFPPPHGNVRSGKPAFINGSTRSTTVMKEAEAAQTEAKTESNQASSQGHGDREADIDKRHKRILASRRYSQKYRLKQLQHIAQLETEAKALQAEVAVNIPRIKYSDRHNSLLRAENNLVKQKLCTFSCELMFKEAEYEELKKERDMLNQLFEGYQQQQQFQEMLKVNPGNYQFSNMGLNPPEVDDEFMEDEILPQMVNQNMNHYRDGGFDLDLTSVNIEPSNE